MLDHSFGRVGFDDYFLAEAHFRVLGAGQLEMAIIEDVATGGLMFRQIDGLEDLDSRCRSGGPIRILMNCGDDTDKLQQQVVRSFVRRQRINRGNQ